MLLKMALKEIIVFHFALYWPTTVAAQTTLSQKY